MKEYKAFETLRTEDLELQVARACILLKPCEESGEAWNNILISMTLDTDMWADGDMESVIRYLRGGTKLNVPPAIREILNMNE